MADLIIEAKRRNLSRLNFSSFGQNLSRQKLSSQGSRVGSRESSVAFMQAKQKLLTKQKVKQRQRKAAAAGNSFSCWTCHRFDFYFALFFLLLQYLAKFLPKSLSCGGRRCCPGSSLEINYTCRSRKYDCHASRRWQIDRERVEMKPA